MTSLLPDQIAQAWPAQRWQDLHVLVAVSGGADSVALLLGLWELKRQAVGRGRLYVGHFNHGLRSEESDADARWVGELAERLGVEVLSGQHEGQSAERLDSEQAARQARYRFLLESAEHTGARYVATGHTADDQAETILHRVLRGASIKGLGGIPFARSLSPAVQVVRPLLGVSRAEVEQFLSQRDQGYRTDSSNAVSDFTRNLIRNQVLPSLRETFGEHVDQSLRRLGAQAAEAHAVIEALAREVAGHSIQRPIAAGTLIIDPAQFGAAPRLVVREAMKMAWETAGWPLQSMGAAEWERLYALTQDPAACSFDLPGGISAAWESGVVTLRRADA